MGCIEIMEYGLTGDGFKMFNRNMGCIEIRKKMYLKLIRICLIETWDVLKSYYTAST